MCAVLDADSDIPDPDHAVLWGPFALYSHSQPVIMKGISNEDHFPINHFKHDIKYLPVGLMYTIYD